MINRFLSAALLVQLGAGLALSQDNVLSAAEKAQGFALLFDGSRKSLEDNFVNYEKNGTGTTALTSNWAVNPVTKIIDNQTGEPGDIRSKKVFKDFDFRLDFRNDKNQGIFYRFNVSMDRAWQTGIEYAIDNAPPDAKSSAGAAYGLYAPSPLTYTPFSEGKWNSVRIVAKADSVEHWMNGVKVVGFKLHSTSFWTAYSASKWNASNTMTLKVPGNRNGGYIEQGYIGFQGDHGGKWQIKNMKISEAACLGPVSTTRMSTDCAGVGIADLGTTDARLARTALRRTSSGVTLSLAGLDASEATLLALDGRVMRGEIARGDEASFAGSFRSGLYVVRMKTASGVVTGKVSLL